MNYGIGNNIIPPELQYAFDLQERAKMEAAMARQEAMNPQPAVPANNVVSQLEASLNRGISSAPAPNMQFARGGIVGYAQGGMPQQPAPAPTTQLDPELIAFIKALAEIQKEEETSFPEERDLIEQKRNLLLQNTSPRIKQMYSDLDTVPTFKKGGRVSLEDVMSDPENSAGIRAIMASLAQAGRDIVEFTGDEILAMLGSPVARGQNDVMQQVGRGVMGMAEDAFPSDTRNAARDFNREGLQALNNRDLGPSVVERMAEVGRAMPGSNLGDRPVRDAMAEGIASMAPGGTGTNVSPGLAAAQRRRDLRNANMGTGSGLPQATSMSQADMDARELGLESGRGGLGALLSNMFKGSPQALRNRESFNTRVSEVEQSRADEDYNAIREEAFRRARENANIPSTDDGALTSAEVSRINEKLNRNNAPTDGRSLYERTKGYMPDFGNIISNITGGDSEAAAQVAPTATPRLNDTSAELYESRRASAPSVRGGDLDISREQAFADMFPNAQASVDDLARRKAAMRKAFPNAQAEADRYREYRKTNPRQQPKTGIAGILDKVADVATILGRGAGASKGYEGAKIVQESQRAREAQAKLDQDKLLKLLQFEQEDRRMANVRNTDQERYVRDYVQAQRDSGETAKTDAQLRAEAVNLFRTMSPAYTAGAKIPQLVEDAYQASLGFGGDFFTELMQARTPDEKDAVRRKARAAAEMKFSQQAPATTTASPVATGPRPDLSSFLK
jgi:hypothetical protein